MEAFPAEHRRATDGFYGAAVRAGAFCDVQWLLVAFITIV